MGVAGTVRLHAGYQDIVERPKDMVYRKGSGVGIKPGTEIDRLEASAMIWSTGCRVTLIHRLFQAARKSFVHPTDAGCWVDAAQGRHSRLEQGTHQVRIRYPSSTKGFSVAVRFTANTSVHGFRRNAKGSDIASPNDQGVSQGL